MLNYGQPLTNYFLMPSADQDLRSILFSCIRESNSFQEFRNAVIQNRLYFEPDILSHIIKHADHFLAESKKNHHLYHYILHSEELFKSARDAALKFLKLILHYNVKGFMHYILYHPTAIVSLITASTPIFINELESIKRKLSDRNIKVEISVYTSCRILYLFYKERVITITKNTANDLIEKIKTEIIQLSNLLGYNFLVAITTHKHKTSISLIDLYVSHLKKSNQSSLLECFIYQVIKWSKWDYKMLLGQKNDLDGISLPDKNREFLLKHKELITTVMNQKSEP